MSSWLSILILLLASSISWGQQSNDALEKRKAKKDSLWQVRNNFLNNSIFTNIDYQDSLLKPYEGLWKLVRTERNRYGSVDFPTNRDFLFSENKVWYLDYPCSMNGYSENLHFRNDSIFFSTMNRVYIEKKKIEFRNDTLVIFSNRKHDESNFYLKQELDSSLLADLKKNHFNKSCIKNVWNLTSINDGGSDEWIIEDGYHTHVPREINFESESIKIEGIYLITSENKKGKFEILQYTRQFDEENGETGFLVVKELKKRKGIEYHYFFELKK